MKSKKKNVLKDGVKNAEEQQNIGERENVTIGKKTRQNLGKKL